MLNAVSKRDVVLRSIHVIIVIVSGKVDLRHAVRLFISLYCKIAFFSRGF